MDPSQHGVPAGSPRSMSLDDVHGTASTRKNPIGAAFGAPSQHKTFAGGYVPRLPSPDPEILHRPQHRYNVPVSHWADGERPPTPPLHHQDDDLQYQRRWDASLLVRGPSGHTLLPATQADYTSPCGIFIPARDDHLSGRQDFQSAPSRQCIIHPPRLHPPENLLQSSPEQQTTYSKPTPLAPSIQQWPTHNMRAHDLKVDGATKKKQEAYMRKGEAVRRRTISSQNSAPQYTPILEPASTPHRKCKARILDDQVMPTPSPPLRPPNPSYGQQQQQQSATSGLVMNYHLTPQQTPSYDMDWIGRGRYHTPIPSSYYQQYWGKSDAGLTLYPPQHLPHTPAPLPPSPPKAIDPETIPQHITSNYHEYKWSVKLYQLQTETGYNFAECFLETYFQRNIYTSNEHKWHTHTSKGFIKDGDRLSILVLHNAANPFEWVVQPVSTTSIGVYGLYAHKHDEIHWTTIAPSIPEWFELCSDHGYLAIKQKWHTNMRASDKRFHRAYWLAANMLPLNRMLNNSLAPEKPHDLLEDDEGERFGVAEEDLQHEWTGETASAEESEKIWQKLVDEVDGLRLESFNPEHLATGGSERAFMVD
ncbi:hypothetical protein G6011_04783 [Alternaria panax]|uniref:Uncharacterized protein n=1 Tax=Alternaria panax TaxID=48097 RepID=A0AAD4IH59_9PLEO|nr:hypothetical protein G6011_04783 [Alternaria panax]